MDRYIYLKKSSCEVGMLSRLNRIIALCVVVIFAATSLGFADDAAEYVTPAEGAEAVNETQEAGEASETIETPAGAEVPDEAVLPEAAEVPDAEAPAQAGDDRQTVMSPEMLEKPVNNELEDFSIQLMGNESLPEILKDKSIYYLGDNVPGHLCLVASNTYMLRRMAIIQESPVWSLITLWAINAKGIRYKEYRYSNNGYIYHVNKYKKFDVQTIAGVKAQLIDLLNGRPEGVIIFGQHSQDKDEAAGKASDHGILITEYRNGAFYGIDPSHNRNGKSKGIEKLSDTTIVTLKGVTHYMCIQDIVYDPSTLASTLQIRDYSYPKTLTKGQWFTVAGNILSNCAISKVNVSIIDSKGKAVISKSATPKTVAYSLSKLDNSIKFGTLAVGNYTYKVTASDTERTKTLVNKKFKIEPASTLKIKKAKYPKKLKKGKSFKIKGKITSNYKIKKVTVAVYKKSGKVKYKVTKKPNKKSYNISKISKKIKFKKLKKGTYYFKVTATDSKKTKVLLNKKFKVKK